MLKTFKPVLLVKLNMPLFFNCGGFVS